MPSLYETTAVVGDVASSNFTTLYNASGLAVPNAGGGAVTGNLNIGGNLTVQGSSTLNGPVTLGSTLCLPNYCFPLADGTANQLLATDGAGNLYWTTVSSLTGTYTIQADTTTGGSNLTLVNSLGPTDSVKFASGTNVSVVRTDANTITINATDTNTTYTIDASATTGGANLNLVGSDSTTDTVKFAAGTNVNIVQTDANTITINGTTDPLASGTIKGQVLYWNGTAWVASRVIEADAAGGRLVTQYNNSTAGVNSAFYTRKNFGSSNYTFGDGVAMNYSLTSTAQGLNQLGVTGFQIGGESTDPDFFVTSTVDNFASQISLMTLNSNDNSFNGYNLTLLANNTGTPTQDAYFNVERGTSPNAFLKWNEGSQSWEFNYPLIVSGNLTTPKLTFQGGGGFQSVVLGNTVTTTSTAQVPLAGCTESGPLMKIILSITDNVTGATHGVELMAIQNASTVMLTTYAELYTSTALATFAVDQSGGLMRLLVTPASSNSTSFSYLRTAVE